MKISEDKIYTSNFKRIALVLIYTFLFVGGLLAQSDLEVITPDELKRDFRITHFEPVQLWYDKYSRENLAKLKDIVATSEYRNEWEGNYSDGGYVTTGKAGYMLDFDKGFATFYIDTCYPALTNIGYGRLVNKPDSVDFIYEFSSEGKAKIRRFIKVRWDDRLYLVDENALLPFSEKAVGIFVPDENGNLNEKWRSYLVQRDWEKPVTGFPVFPTKYKRFERRPIGAKITYIGKRVITSEKNEDGTVHSRSAVYLVTIDAGLEKKVKRGMSFEIPETKDTIKITKVIGNKGVGTLTRSLGGNGTEKCWDADRNEFSCVAAKAGMKVNTVVDAADY